MKKDWIEVKSAPTNTPIYAKLDNGDIVNAMLLKTSSECIWVKYPNTHVSLKRAIISWRSLR